MVGALISGALHAQVDNPAAAENETLEEQITNILRVSNKYAGFKLVREEFITAFVANMNDTLGVRREEVEELRQVIATQNEKMLAQNNGIADREQLIGELERESAYVSLFGISMPKSTYRLVVYGIIGLLIAMIAFALTRMRYAIQAARGANAKRAKLAEEVEAGKKKRLEMEQSLRRQLQDEINRNRATGSGGGARQAAPAVRSSGPVPPPPGAPPPSPPERSDL